MGRRILVVEDSPTQAERVRLLLEGEGYRVEVARNGREGLEKVRSTHPGLVISDVVMPEMDGFALCRAVKSTEATRRIPFVLLTERNAPADVIQGFEVGADNFITKPFTDAALVDRVRRIFEHLELHQTSGGPESEVALHVGGRRFVVSAGKAQIVELLLSTLEDLAQVNAALQQRERELEVKNEELEAFSYSVSHDLRAPLRSIDGFSQALLEDYAEKLDAQGKDYLHRVRAASQRMAQLIDDLLQLSRLSRGEIHREEVDLSGMARAIVAELQKTQPDRRVEYRIAQGVVAQGDARLLRVVLDNLLSNAWKFTSKNPQATIEFGVTQNDGMSAYFVRDDGAGFDMAYGAKLFGPFQRLHGPTEFPGTGIGLATVQRIVHRHGGRVWAAGAVGQGATFSFTL